MEFNEVENLSEEQILDLYSNIVDRDDIIASRIESVYTMYYTKGCMGETYYDVNGTGCWTSFTFTYHGYCYCDYSCLYAIGPTYTCPWGGAK